MRRRLNLPQATLLKNQYIRVLLGKYNKELTSKIFSFLGFFDMPQGIKKRQRRRRTRILLHRMGRKERHTQKPERSTEVSRARRLRRM
jgi:hypothetical protein